MSALIFAGNDLDPYLHVSHACARGDLNSACQCYLFMGTTTVGAII